MFHRVPRMSCIAYARGPVPHLVRRTRVHDGYDGYDGYDGQRRGCDTSVFHGVPWMSCIAYARIRRGVPHDVEVRIARTCSSEDSYLLLVLLALFASSYEPYDEDHESRDEPET